MKKLVLVTALALSLQGCVLAVGAAVGTAATVVVYDHRKLEKIAEDQRINNQIIQRISAIPGIKDNAHINVTTFNHVVLLTGETINADIRNQAGSIARSAEGVERVYNEIVTAGLSSNLSRASDAWITAKIKTQMLAMKELKASSIKVVTENGVVYLMGKVSREQAENTVDIARDVAGVQKVIKIFEYTDGSPASMPAGESSSGSAQTSGAGEPQKISESANDIQPMPAANSPSVASNSPGTDSTQLLNTQGTQPY